jgi:TonB-dependent receptor
MKISTKLALMASAMGLSLGLLTPAMAQDGATDAANNPDHDKATEIVIFANRAKASDAQMRAKNTISVLSKEDLDHTAVHNVAEALGLLPGVTVTNTGSGSFGGIDGASRGEGMYAAVRGMNTEFNVNMINGVTVAQGLPYTRSVQLSLLPPSGLQTIVLNKSSMADMDGDAIGGTIDFRTPTSLNYAKDMMSLTVSGRVESRARDYDDSGLGGGVAAEFAHKFGDKFGIYASAFYDERNYANSEMAGIMAARNDGGWGWLVASDANGNTDPLLNNEANLTQTGINVGVSTGFTQRHGTNFSLDYTVDDSLSLYARGTYTYAQTQQNSTLSQFSANSKSYSETVPGSGRYALSVDSISTRLWYETNPETAKLGTLSIGAEKQSGNWHFSPQLFYSYGANNRPNHIEASARINQSDNYNSGVARPLGGLSIGYSDNFPIPLMTNDIYLDLNDSIDRLLARRAGQLTEEFSDQNKWGGKFDARYDAPNDGLLQYVKFGGKYSDSHRRVTNRDWTNDHFANLLGEAGITWADLGMTDGSYAAIFPGVYEWSVPKVNQDKLFDYFYKYQTDARADSCAGLFVNNYNCNTQMGDEKVASAYAMAGLQSGNFEIIPGLRYEHVTIDNTYWIIPTIDDTEQAGHFESNSTSYDEVLPSIFVNYRPSNNSVYRADIYRSYTRPAFIQLAGGARTSVSDDGVTNITMGNPDLKPIESTNVDASAEWTNSKGGSAFIGVFYKGLSNYLFDNGPDPVNPLEPTTGITRITQPQNGGDGEVYGIELSLQQKFQDLPGFLSGLSAGMNLTRQFSSVDLDNDPSTEDKAIQNSPEWLGNLRLGYVYHQLSVDLNYNYIGASLANYSSIAGFDTWVRPTQRTDLHVGYEVRNNLKLDLSVSNLFKDYSYWAHIAKHSLAISDIVDSGSTTLLTLKYTY